jgi:hypothetical protein
MTSPLRLKVTGRQTRLQFGTPESLSRARNRSGAAAAAARPTRSLSDRILGLFRIAAPGYGVGGNPGSVSAFLPRVTLPVVIRGDEPQSRLAAAPRHAGEKSGGGLTKGKHRLVLCPVHDWEPSGRDDAEWAQKLNQRSTK